MKRQKTKKGLPERKGFWDKQSQDLKPDLKTPHGRQRFFTSLFSKLGILVGFALVVYFVVLGIQLYQSWEIKPQIVEPLALPQIIVTGNSSLPTPMIEEMVKQVIEPGLAKVDPFKIKKLLETNGQVKSAAIEKDFPDKLRIHIIERLPVLMMAAMDESHALSFWAIDDEGILYRPFDLQRMKTLDLPFIEGLQIDKIEDGVTRIQGIEKVHYLMELLKRDAYAVYNDVKSVSLMNFNEGEAELGAVIILKGTQLKKVIFGVDNFEYQVVKLLGVMSVSGKLQLSDKNVIDLSYSGDAIVR